MMMLAALVVTVIGLKVVGLVLIVALLIIPPVAARFWTESVGRMIWIAGAIGGISGYAGAAVSASAPNLPTGPIIVLMAAGVFVASLLFGAGSRRGCSVHPATPVQGAGASPAGPSGDRPAGADPGDLHPEASAAREPDPRRWRADRGRARRGGQGVPRRTAMGHRPADTPGCRADRTLRRSDTRSRTCSRRTRSGSSTAGSVRPSRWRADRWGPSSSSSR